MSDYLPCNWRAFFSLILLFRAYIQIRRHSVWLWQRVLKAFISSTHIVVTMLPVSKKKPWERSISKWLWIFIRKILKRCQSVLVESLKDHQSFAIKVSLSLISTTLIFRTSKLKNKNTPFISCVLVKCTFDDLFLKWGGKT